MSKKSVAMTPVETAIYEYRLEQDSSVRDTPRIECVTFYQDTHFPFHDNEIPDLEPEGFKATMAFYIYLGNADAEALKLINRFRDILEENWHWDISECRTISRVRYEYSGNEGKESCYPVLKQLEKAEADSILKNLNDYISTTQLVMNSVLTIVDLEKIKTWDDIINAHATDENKLYFFTSVEDPFTEELKPYSRYEAAA